MTSGRLAAMPADPAASLASFVEGWVESGEVTAVFAAIATAGETIWSAGAAAPGVAAPSPMSLFDAASLTKPWMATLALRLDASGELPLGTRVGEVWPACAENLRHRTLGDLLRHRAGFEPWTPLYRRCRSRASAEELLLSGRMVEGGGRVLGASRRVDSSRPGGARRPLSAGQRYSDLDYVLWGFAVEERLQAELETVLRRAVVEPLEAAGVEVAPGRRHDVIACLCDNAREVELAADQGLRVARRPPPATGEPQDGNARFLGGLAGHAGLFVTAEAMLALGREWLAALGGGGSVLPAATARQALAGSGEYALGWARRRASGSAGHALSASAFGHPGFTGTSLWIDPSRRTLFLLLAHRSGATSQLNAARRRFHALAAAFLGRERGDRGAERPRVT